MNPVAADAARYTPDDLLLDRTLHRYTLHGKPLLSVTGVLRAAGLIDERHFTEEARLRGSRVHAAIETWLALGDRARRLDIAPDDAPYLAAFQRFMADCPFRVDAVEEMLCDPTLACAGTLDLRGQFLDIEHAAVLSRTDVLDIKTGSTPCWIGYQVAGYLRLLPPSVATRCRRWGLTLHADSTYRLDALVNRHDDAVFMAALVVAQAKRGWLA